jgi:hypothetical protein
MKKLLLSFAVLFIFCSLKAQGKFDFLKDLKIFDVEIDYSKATIRGKSAKNFFALENLENDNFEANYKREMLIKFIKYVNFPLPSNYSIGLDTLEVEYKIVVNVKVVDINGNTEANILIVKIDTEETVSQFVHYGRGGTFGSFTNLSGDGMIRLGTNIGYLFARKIRKINKN